MNLREKADKLLTWISILYLAILKKETPIIAKISAALAVGYVLSPIDFVPDFVPLIGLLDDLIIVPILIYFARLMIPDEIYEACREEAKDFEFKVTKKWFYAIPIVLIWIVLILFLTQMLFNA